MTSLLCTNRLTEHDPQLLTEEQKQNNSIV